MPCFTYIPECYLSSWYEAQYRYLLHKVKKKTQVHMRIRPNMHLLNILIRLSSPGHRNICKYQHIEKIYISKKCVKLYYKSPPLTCRKCHYLLGDEKKLFCIYWKSVLSSISVSVVLAASIHSLPLGSMDNQSSVHRSTIVEHEIAALLAYVKVGRELLSIQLLNLKCGYSFECIPIHAFTHSWTTPSHKKILVYGY